MAYRKYVWFGLLIGILGSLVFAAIFYFIFGEFEGFAKMIFEITIQFLSAVLLTTIIFEMISGKFMVTHLEQEIQQKVQSSRKWGLFFSTFLSVLNEGIELIIFLTASFPISGVEGVWGALLGIMIAVVLGLLFFRGSIRINFKLFFILMTGFLVFLTTLFSFEAFEKVAELVGSPNPPLFGIIGCVGYFVLTLVFVRLKKM